jgi:hypothetical protein
MLESCVALPKAGLEVKLKVLEDVDVWYMVDSDYSRTIPQERGDTPPIPAHVIIAPACKSYGVLQET